MLPDNQKGVAEGDEMGLGKTIMALAGACGVR